MAAMGCTTRGATGWLHKERLEDAGDGGQSYHDGYEEKEQVHGVGRDQGEAAKCRDPVRRKLLRKRARKAHREFDVGRAALPRGEVIHRPVVTKLRIGGRACEGKSQSPL